MVCLVRFLEFPFNSIARRSGIHYTYRNRNPFLHIPDIDRFHNSCSSILSMVLHSTGNIRLLCILFFGFLLWFYCIGPSNSILLYIRSYWLLPTMGNFGVHTKCPTRRLGFQWDRFVPRQTWRNMLSIEGGTLCWWVFMSYIDGLMK